MIRLNKNDIAHLVFKKKSVSISISEIQLVITVFFQVLCEELIYNSIEFVINPMAKPETQVKLKTGYVEGELKDYIRNTSLYHGGKYYKLRLWFDRYPAFMKMTGYVRRVKFTSRAVDMLAKELAKGRRYYNSAMHEILYKQ